MQYEDVTHHGTIFIDSSSPCCSSSSCSASTNPVITGHMPLPVMHHLPIHVVIAKVCVFWMEDFTIHFESVSVTQHPICQLCQNVHKDAGCITCEWTIFLWCPGYPTSHTHQELMLLWNLIDWLPCYGLVSVKLVKHWCVLKAVFWHMLAYFSTSCDVAPGASTTYLQLPCNPDKLVCCSSYFFWVEWQRAQWFSASFCMVWPGIVTILKLKQRNS